MSYQIAGQGKLVPNVQAKKPGKVSNWEKHAAEHGLRICRDAFEFDPNAEQKQQARKAWEKSVKEERQRFRYTHPMVKIW